MQSTEGCRSRSSSGDGGTDTEMPDIVVVGAAAAAAGGGIEVPRLTLEMAQLSLGPSSSPRSPVSPSSPMSPRKFESLSKAPPGTTVAIGRLRSFFAQVAGRPQSPHHRGLCDEFKQGLDAFVALQKTDQDERGLVELLQGSLAWIDPARKQMLGRTLSQWLESRGMNFRVLREEVEMIARRAQLAGVERIAYGPDNQLQSQVTTILVKEGLLFKTIVHELVRGIEKALCEVEQGAEAYSDPEQVLLHRVSGLSQFLINNLRNSRKKELITFARKRLKRLQRDSTAALSMVLCPIADSSVKNEVTAFTKIELLRGKLLEYRTRLRSPRRKQNSVIRPKMRVPGEDPTGLVEKRFRENLGVIYGFLTQAKKGKQKAKLTCVDGDFQVVSLHHSQEDREVVEALLAEVEQARQFFCAKGIEDTTTLCFEYGKGSTYSLSLLVNKISNSAWLQRVIDRDDGLQKQYLELQLQIRTKGIEEVGAEKECFERAVPIFQALYEKLCMSGLTIDFMLNCHTDTRSILIWPFLGVSRPDEVDREVQAVKPYIRSPSLEALLSIPKSHVMARARILDLQIQKEKATQARLARHSAPLCTIPEDSELSGSSSLSVEANPRLASLAERRDSWSAPVDDTLSVYSMGLAMWGKDHNLVKAALDSLTRYVVDLLTSADEVTNGYWAQKQQLLAFVADRLTENPLPAEIIAEALLRFVEQHAPAG